MTKTQQIKKDIADAVANEMMKTKRAPWDSGLLNAFRACNWTSGKNYRGINRLILSFFGTSETAEYMTFLQAKAAKGKVKKGAKALPVIFGMYWNFEEKREADEGDDPDVCGFILKKYSVFPVQSVEGVEPKREIKTAENAKREDIEDAVKRFFAATGLTLEEKNGIAAYNPARHAINIAPIRFYKNADNYYSTLFHEMTHSTGNALSRNMEGNFGSKTYSAEEVCAEFAAAILCARFGIKATKENSATYIAVWAQKIKENPDWLIRGANDAEKAVDYILEKMGIKEEAV